jgi:preprotein translocase subunit SecF
MGDLGRALLNYLKQVLWALFLVYLMLIGIAYLFGKQVGYEISIWVCLGIALLVTVSFISIYICSALWIAVEERVKERRHRRAKK